MIAYNPDWLENALIHQGMDKTSTKVILTKNEIKAVKDKYPSMLYTPNIFIRIGLFILTIVIACFSFGVIGLVVVSNMSENSFGGVCIFFGAICYLALEIMSQSKRHSQSGVDDALAIATVACLLSGINVINEQSLLINAGILFLLTTYLAIRFIDMLMSAIACLALIAITYSLYIEIGPIAKATTPFLGIIVSGCIYFLIPKLATVSNRNYYSNCFSIIEIVSLVCLYLAGNYFIVREASIVLFELPLKNGEGIPFGWLFWLFTIAIPILYLFKGIQKKNKMLLRVGLLLIAIQILTVRNYYYQLPLEELMTIGGLLLLTMAYLLTRYLKESKHGFTYQQAVDDIPIEQLNIEGLIITESFNTASPIAESQTQFGGGSGGGGGATGIY